MTSPVVLNGLNVHTQALKGISMRHGNLFDDALVERCGRWLGNQKKAVCGPLPLVFPVYFLWPRLPQQRQQFLSDAWKTRQVVCKGNVFKLIAYDFTDKLHLVGNLLFRTPSKTTDNNDKRPSR